MRAPRIIAAALALLGTAALCSAGEDVTKGPIPWGTSLPAAQKTAAKEKKAILVDFWAEWCGPCKEMLKTTYQDKTVAERAKRFVPVLVNVDKQPEVAKKYSVSAIPVVLFLDAKGKVLVRAEAKHNASEMLKLMDQAQTKLK